MRLARTRDNTDLILDNDNNDILMTYSCVLYTAVRCARDVDTPEIRMQDGFRARIKLLAQREYHRVDGRGMRA